MLLTFVLTAIVALSGFMYTEGVHLGTGVVTDYNSLVANGEIFAQYIQRLQQQNSGCECANDTCSCCIDLHVPQIGLDNTACLAVVYLSQDVGISAALTWDEKSLFNETVSLRDPPPLCIGIPVLPDALGLCVRFSDIKYEDDVHMCFNFEFHLLFIPVLTLPLGCTNF